LVLAEVLAMPAQTKAARAAIPHLAQSPATAAAVVVQIVFMAREKKQAQTAALAVVAAVGLAQPPVEQVEQAIHRPHHLHKEAMAELAQQTARPIHLAAAAAVHQQPAAMGLILPAVEMVAQVQPHQFLAAASLIPAVVVDLLMPQERLELAAQAVAVLAELVEQGQRELRILAVEAADMQQAAPAS
jgi:hypothetical protein